MTGDFDSEFRSVFTGDTLGIAAKRRVIDDPYIHRLQRRHFILFDVLPCFGTLAALAWLFARPIGWPEFVAFLTMWTFSGLGISSGYHRLFAHKSYTATRGTRIALAIAGSMAGQGGLISWVAMHRRHHERGDQEGDMHSPNLHGPGWRGKLRGFLHAHFTWMIAHPYPNVVHYAPDLVRDSTMSYVSRHYYRWVVLGFIMPAVFCALVEWSWTGLASGFLWGGMVRMFVLEQGIWSLNSFCHLVGKRSFATRDQSRNIGWLAPFIFGESWHHNHHAFPGSASFGLRWYRVDPGYWFIRMLGLLGLAKEIKVPAREQVEMRVMRT
ncbi:acyl-CoA desaturase [Burkholderia ubonensis]|uniref:acyl-CoA desaturase n=1 Tax=Burkholderia ubonensis TaxID=101571 RepID=UPI00075A4710|nr:fatty acid desaturase [Burkholderia ubonensis]AOI68047.1 fatty acid desaturase [Burkholderia ubonensis]KUZ22994.1 fatty acid desaturase [Burkholderia ubonensis]KUZ24742.1 fatty acid desaturase [Burkholderia ubonensis]KUZ36674.1 fatty acid desaturase [Burkholderia ubonensis]KUZ51456.1 fatty acid desaturase [Burkholderia ubonensis]